MVQIISGIDTLIGRSMILDVTIGDELYDRGICIVQNNEVVNIVHNAKKCMILQCMLSFLSFDIL